MSELPQKPAMPLPHRVAAAPAAAGGSSHAANAGTRHRPPSASSGAAVAVGSLAATGEIVPPSLSAGECVSLAARVQMALLADETEERIGAGEHLRQRA